MHLGWIQGYRLTFRQLGRFLTRRNNSVNDDPNCTSRTEGVSSIKPDDFLSLEICRDMLRWAREQWRLG